MKIIFLATGGTFDKLYYDALSDYQIGDPQVPGILRQAAVSVDYQVDTIIGKDSLDINDADRAALRSRIKSDTNTHFVVIHGTDTMPETACSLQGINDKTIVLTGAMQPARFKDSDAEFNVGFAVAAVQLLESGVYIAMNGRVFAADKVRKNRDQGYFETI
ncbi:MAG: asparaginase [Chromatiales bacterium]|nr:asparaginase [Chromatiales bacterium]